jgi:hypothetical protein
LVCPILDAFDLVDVSCLPLSDPRLHILIFKIHNNLTIRIMIVNV